MASLNASPRKDLEAGITPVILPSHIKEQLANLWVTETFEEFLIHYAKAKYDVRKQNRDARMARLAAHMAILDLKAVQNLEQHLNPKAEK